MFQLYECLLLRFRPKEFCFHSSLGDLTQGPTDMRKSQHKPIVEVGKTQKVVELCQSGWRWPILNDLDVGCVTLLPLMFVTQYLIREGLDVVWKVTLLAHVRIPP